MKKSLLILLLAFAGPKLATAKILPEDITVTAQDSSSVNVPSNVPFGVGTDGKDHRLAVDNTGALKMTTLTAAPVALTYTINVATVSALSPTGMTVYSVLSQTATSFNVTTLAGVSANCIVYFSGNGVGVGSAYRFQDSMSSTAPVNLTSSVAPGPNGNMVFNTVVSQGWGPYVPGTWIHIAGVSASTTAQVSIHAVRP